MSISKRTHIAVAVSAVLAVGISPLGATDVFKARMLTGKAPAEPPMVSVQIQVDSWTTPEEIVQLQNVLGQAGVQAFLNAFGTMNKGVIRIMSAHGWNLPIHAAQVVTLEKGKKVRLFLNRQSWDPGSYQKPARHYFMVMELTLNEKGKGEGRFYEDAQIKLDPSRGTIEMETYESAPKILPQAQEVIKKPKEK